MRTARLTFPWGPVRSARSGGATRSHSSATGLRSRTGPRARGTMRACSRGSAWGGPARSTPPSTAMTRTPAPPTSAIPRRDASMLQRTEWGATTASSAPPGTSGGSARGRNTARPWPCARSGSATTRASASTSQRPGGRAAAIVPRGASPVPKGRCCSAARNPARCSFPGCFARRISPLFAEGRARRSAKSSAPRSARRTSRSAFRAATEPATSSRTRAKMLRGLRAGADRLRR